MLTKEELLEIIVSLDQESYRESEKGRTERADMLRELKWKVFKMMSELEQRAMVA